MKHTRKKIGGKKPQSVSDQWDNFQQPKNMQLEAPERRKEEGGGAQK